MRRTYVTYLHPDDFRAQESRGKGLRQQLCTANYITSKAFQRLSGWAVAISMREGFKSDPLVKAIVDEIIARHDDMIEIWTSRLEYVWILPAPQKYSHAYCKMLRSRSWWYRFLLRRGKVLMVKFISTAKVQACLELENSGAWMLSSIIGVWNCQY